MVVQHASTWFNRPNPAMSGKIDLLEVDPPQPLEALESTCRAELQRGFVRKLSNVVNNGK